MDTSLLGKKVLFENNVYTIYEVDNRGVYAHSGDNKSSCKNGIVINGIFLNYEEVREKLFKPGRPSMGRTKKVSITLSEDHWQYIDKVLLLNEFSYSQYFRMLVENEVSLSEKAKNKIDEEKEVQPKISYYKFNDFNLYEVEVEGGRQKNARVNISIPERQEEFTVTFYMVDYGDFSRYTDYEFEGQEKRISYKEYHNILKDFIQNHADKQFKNFYINN